MPAQSYDCSNLIKGQYTIPKGRGADRNFEVHAKEPTFNITTRPIQTILTEYAKSFKKFLTLLEEQPTERAYVDNLGSKICYLNAKRIAPHPHSWKTMDTIKLAVRLLCPHILEKLKLYIFSLTQGARSARKKRRKKKTEKERNTKKYGINLKKKLGSILNAAKELYFLSTALDCIIHITAREWASR